MRLSKNKKTTMLFGILLLTLIILEILSALLAYETIGEVRSGLYFMLIFLNIVALLLFFYKKELWAILLAILIALIFVPEQIGLGYKLIYLKEEGANIVNYIYNYKIQKGKFPRDLSEYEYNYSDLKKHFSYSFKSDKNDFSVYFYVATPSTSHYFIHSRGCYWDYYPD